MKPLKTPRITMQDRKLGDEWIGWKGDLGTTEISARTGKRTFMGILLATILLTGLTGWLFWYLITPRLEQFHDALPIIIGLTMLAFWIILTLWFLLMVLSVLTGKDFLICFGKKEFSITFLVPLVLRFGPHLGISKDRLGHSFVKVSNVLIRTRARKVKPENLLILLPRCLQKQIIDRITTFAKEFQIPVYTVSGGTKAREIVTKLRPAAIIGVACERDLLSGIQEILNKIPVIGIPNLRPEGPCKNTVIDWGDFERAVQTFLGSMSTSTP